MGVSFNGIHSERDLGLKLKSIYIPMPKVKTVSVSIPGGDGAIDLTDWTGRPRYEDRAGIKMEFDVIVGDYVKWWAEYSDLAMQIHGKKVRMILDDDPGYYYTARIQIDGNKSNRVYANVVMTGTAQPFKESVNASDGLWEWDSFSFRNSVIRNLTELVINAANPTVTVKGEGIGSVPVIVVHESSGLKIKIGESYVDLSVGRYRFPELEIGNEEATLRFSGAGKVSIDYRGRWL